ncbi:hypothetical protein ABOM_001507, partial [Aspergillus bombycis]
GWMDCLNATVVKSLWTEEVELRHDGAVRHRHGDAAVGGTLLNKMSDNPTNLTHTSES